MNRKITRLARGANVRGLRGQHARAAACSFIKPASASDPKPQAKSCSMRRRVSRHYKITAA